MLRPQFTWLLPGQLTTASTPFARNEIHARILCADLRHPLVVPLLRPAPVAHDYADEIRPATNDRAHFLARRAALRSLVADSIGCKADEIHIHYDEKGAPRVVTHPHLFVSSSGHGPYTALAVGTHPVGVDMEPTTQEIEPLFDVLHRDELEDLTSLPEEERRALFLRIWTAKEACLKALGTGFLEDPQAVAIRTHQDEFTAAGAPLAEANTIATGQFFSCSIDDTPMLAACCILAPDNS